MRQLFSYLASGDSDRRASCRTRVAHFWRQIKSLKTLNVPIFPFVNLICLCLIINHFSCWIMNAFSSEKRYPTSMAFLYQADWHTNLPPFQGARHDHVQSESSSFCFPRELVSFVRPRELVSFDPCHVTRSPPIGNVFELGGITTIFKIVRGAGPPSIDLWSSSDTFNEYIIMQH